MDIHPIHPIRESSHRILNPLTPEKLATIGQALPLRAGATVVDLASGKGELLCTWARDHGITGTGVDLSVAFTSAARARAQELGVGDRVSFIHDDASAYVAAEPVDLAACIGATGIAGGTVEAIDLLERSLRPGGVLLIGEIFWRREPPSQEVARACFVDDKDSVHSLPGLVELIQEHGWDLIEMVLANQDSWDRYVASQWLNLRTWLAENPDHELAAELRAELTTGPVNYTRYGRELLGWGVFALMKR